MSNDTAKVCRDNRVVALEYLYKLRDDHIASKAQCENMVEQLTKTIFLLEFCPHGIKIGAGMTCMTCLSEG